jgi:SAM-dependent methyltransferase
MRRCDIALFAAVASAGAAAVLLAKGQVRAAAVAAGAAAVAGFYCRAESRRLPRPMPTALWWTLLLPRGRHAPRHLLRLLEPKPGERILEIGPGIGVHAIPMARAVAPGGRLAAVDVSTGMLAKLARRASRAGISSIEPQAGSASHLPYPDESFDAAYLISVLGEVPDPQAAWAELRRVLNRDGRLVVGELALDPDFVSAADIRREAEANGFKFAKRVGGSLSYLALFRRDALAPLPHRRGGLCRKQGLILQ